MSRFKFPKRTPREPDGATIPQTTDDWLKYPDKAVTRLELYRVVHRMRALEDQKREFNRWHRRVWRWLMTPFTRHITLVAPPPPVTVARPEPTKKIDANGRLIESA
jgi:hypothetical protein